MLNFDITEAQALEVISDKIKDKKLANAIFEIAKGQGQPCLEKIAKVCAGFYPTCNIKVGQKFDFDKRRIDDYLYFYNCGEEFNEFSVVTVEVTAIRLYDTRQVEVSYSYKAFAREPYTTDKPKEYIRKSTEFLNAYTFDGLTPITN